MLSSKLFKKAGSWSPSETGCITDGSGESDVPSVALTVRVGSSTEEDGSVILRSEGGADSRMRGSGLAFDEDPQP